MIGLDYSDHAFIAQLFSPFPMRLRVVFFDMGDTLFYGRGANELICSLIHKLLVSEGYNVALDDVRRARERWSEVPLSLENVECGGWARASLLLRRLGIAPRPRLVDEVYEAFVEAVIASTRLEEGAREALYELRDEGYVLGILSNTSSYDITRRLLKRAGLYDLFDALVTSDQLGIKKPLRDIFDFALSLVGASPSEAVYVGNDPRSDVLGAKRAGWFAIHKVNEGVDPSPYADAVVRRISEVPDAVRAIESGRARRASP